MMKVAGLALPFFGLIFLGYLAGRIWRRDENALAWLNIFVLYFALPALFFQLISRTPIQQLANWSFVFCTSLATYTAFAIAFAFAMLKNRGNLPEATCRGWSAVMAMSAIWDRHWRLSRSGRKRPCRQP